ncbi:MAG: hypothetical protein QM778_01660 [Myxococcales bacterium]
MWSERKSAGLVLAGLLWGDRALEQVALLPELRQQACARLRSLDAGGETAEAKRRLVRDLVDEVRAEPHRLEDLPVRARALLARHVPRAAGRRLLDGASEARTDYSAEPELVQTLLYWARREARELHDHAAQTPEG